jgi:hypothetical protein
MKLGPGNYSEVAGRLIIGALAAACWQTCDSVFGSPPIGQTIVAALTGDAAPDGNGELSTFLSPVLNDGGHIVFGGVVSSSSGGTNDDSRLLYSQGSGLLQLAAEGQTVPNGNGRFGGFGNLNVAALNESGQAAFTVSTQGCALGFRILPFQGC